MDDPKTLSQLTQLIRWGGVLSSVFVVLGASLLLRIVHRFVQKMGTALSRHRLFFQKLETFFQFGVYIGTALIVIFLSFRVDDKVLALIGGTTAVAVGFALKDLIASFVAGIVIMIDRPFQVGDRVSFGGQYGDITAIGLRSITLQTLDDNTVTIPNNKFMSDITSSGNFGELDMQVVMDLYIGVEEDMVSARRILKEAALSSRYIYLRKPTVVLVTQVFQERTVAVRLRLKAYVVDTKYEKAFETDVHMRAMAALREAGILPPNMRRQSAVAGV